jgi:hypothetical protein
MQNTLGMTDTGHIPTSLKLLEDHNKISNASWTLLVRQMRDRSWCGALRYTQPPLRTPV